MSYVNETNKRLKISEEISLQLEGIVKGVYLGGSTGYGQNYSVTKESDIDMGIICDKERIRELESTRYFKQNIPKEVIEMFEEEKINFFWVTKIHDDVETNCFIYSTLGFLDFCTFKGNLKGYIEQEKSPKEIQENYGFNGELICFRRNVTPFGKGFLYEKPTLAENRFFGAPPRDDFTRGFFILYQEDSFLEDTSKLVWENIIRKLISEYGPIVDLKKHSIVKSEFAYHRKRDKLPKDWEENINNETERILKNF